jgi:antitoxin component HigA of HigAB toxin-antitoxin module
MIIKKVETETDYRIALKRIETLIALKLEKASEAYNELDRIGGLVAAYEEIHYPIGTSIVQNKKNM